MIDLLLKHFNFVPFRTISQEKRDRGKRMKTGYREIQINREWFISD
jgi:hypothetical protein